MDGAPHARTKFRTATEPRPLAPHSRNTLHPGTPVNASLERPRDTSTLPVHLLAISSILHGFPRDPPPAFATTPSSATPAFSSPSPHPAGARTEPDVRAAFLTHRRFSPLVFAPSLKTVVAAGVGGLAYVRTKLAVLRFVENVAIESERRGAAYTVHPGGVAMELAEGVGDELGSQVLVDRVSLAEDAVMLLTRGRR